LVFSRHRRVVLQYTRCQTHHEIGRHTALRVLGVIGREIALTAAPDLLERQEADAVLVDRAYDSNDLRDRKVFIPHDVDIYKHRNRIERFPPAQRWPFRLKKLVADAAAGSDLSVSEGPLFSSRGYNRDQE
jgi:hypothetical protein